MSNSSNTRHKLQKASPCTGHLVPRDIANGEYCLAGEQVNAASARAVGLGGEGEVSSPLGRGTGFAVFPSAWSVSARVLFGRLDHPVPHQLDAWT